MNGNNGGLRIAVRPISEGSQLHNMAAGIPVQVTVLLGVALTACREFPSVTAPWWMLLLGMLGFSAVLWLLQLTGKGSGISLAALLVIAAGVVIFRDQVLSGMGCLGNDLLARLSRITGRVYLDFALARQDAVLWGIVPVLAVIVVLLHLSVQTGKMLFFLPVVIPVYGAVLTGFFSVSAGGIVLGLGCILLLMTHAGALTKGRAFQGAPAWLLPVLLCVAISLGLGLYAQDGTGKTREWDSWLHSLFYDQESNSMPEGNLKNLPPWNKNDTPALKITMTEPQKLYLRGQIYEVYEGTAWRSLEGEALAESETLFYWLHQSGFYGQSQIGTAAAFTSQAAPEQLTVENISACSAHGYYPYALADCGTLDAGSIGDADLSAAAEIRYIPGSVPQWYHLQQSLASAQNRKNVEPYLSAEEAYEAYVTEVDLQLTNESWTVLTRHLGEEGSGKTLWQIREVIRNYLEENLVYDEDVRSLNGSGDFLQYTLEKSGSGYSVHYATAATLMLRYFGVPARYVEGYFLPADAAEEYQPGEAILLTEEYAHAWAEYYLPGVGFIPFEVTPGYVDEEEADMGGAQSENQQIYTGTHRKYAKVEQPERISEPERSRFAFSMKPVYLVYGVALMLAALLAVILMKRRKFRKAMAAMEAAPNRDAIAMAFGYARKLLTTCGAPEVAGSERAEELNREALFSNHSMTDAQRGEMTAYGAQVLQTCKETWTIFQKLRYWAWDCLY